MKEVRGRGKKISRQFASALKLNSHCKFTVVGFLVVEISDCICSQVFQYMCIHIYYNKMISKAVTITTVAVAH